MDKGTDASASDSRKTFTYFIQAGPDGPIKIGLAEDVEQRLKELQTGCPDDLRLIGRMDGNHEKNLHQHFKQFWIRGEWFRPDVRIMAFIVEHAESCGKVESLVVAARNVVRAYEGMNEEISEMWMLVVSAFSFKGHCPWPHAKAFDDGVMQLKRRLTELAGR